MAKLSPKEQLEAFAKRQIAICERAFGDGNQRAALDAIFYAFAFECMPPKWAMDYYRANYVKIMDFQAKSLDEAFGKPFPKGTNINAKRKYQQLRIAVLETVMRIKGREPDLPFGDILFEEVGNIHGISKTVASEIYYKFMKELDHR
jgi:hypothetical protein